MRRRRRPLHPTRNRALERETGTPFQFPLRSAPFTTQCFPLALHESSSREALYIDSLPGVHTHVHVLQLVASKRSTLEWGDETESHGAAGRVKGELELSRDKLLFSNLYLLSCNYRSSVLCCSRYTLIHSSGCTMIKKHLKLNILIHIFFTFLRRCTVIRNFGGNSKCIHIVPHCTTGSCLWGTSFQG